MKIIHASVCLFVGCLAGQLAAQTVTDYRVFYQTAYTQDTADSTALATNPYRLNVEVTGTNLPAYNTIDFADGAITNPASVRKAFNAAPSRVYYTASSYASESALNLGDGFGTYTLALGSSATATLDISSDVFSNAPTLSGGLWSGGRLQVNDGGHTFNFATPVNADAVRLYIYQQGEPFNSYSYITGGSSTSIVVPDADLVLGLNYGATLYFYNIGDTDTAFGGASGSAGYMTTNEFQFSVVAIPEPSASGLITGLLLLAHIGFGRNRRRST